MSWTYLSLTAVGLQAVPVPEDTGCNTEIPRVPPDHAALAHTSWVPGATHCSQVQFAIF